MNVNTRKRTSIGRKIIGFILFALLILLAAGVLIVMIHKINTVVLKSTYQEVFIYEIIMLVILLLFVLDVRFGIFTWARNKATKVIGWILRIIVILLTIGILFLCGRVIFGSFYNTSGPASNALVLGMALENGQPTKDLVSRVSTAKEYLDDNDDATLVLTGGNPDKSGKTEAQVMQDLLVQYGAPESSLFLEDKAQTTEENFINTAKMIDPDEPVVLISSDYHMARAVRNAKEAGFTNILRCPARSNILTYGSNMMWEVVMEINDLIK